VQAYRVTADALAVRADKVNGRRVDACLVEDGVDTVTEPLTHGVVPFGVIDSICAVQCAQAKDVLSLLRREREGLVGERRVLERAGEASGVRGVAIHRLKLKNSDVDAVHGVATLQANHTRLALDLRRVDLEKGAGWGH
jgi:hypothetical protein